MYEPRKRPDVQPLLLSGIFSLSDVHYLKKQWKWPTEHGVIGYGYNTSGTLTPRAEGMTRTSSGPGFTTPWQSFCILDEMHAMEVGDSLQTTEISQVARTPDGRVYNWGSNNVQGRATTASTAVVPTVLGGSTYADWRWTQASAGGGWGAAIRNDGTLWSWGLGTNNRNGQTGTTTLTAPTQIGTANTWAYVSCGRDYGAAIMSDGTLWTWGLNTTGQTGQGTSTGSTVGPTQIGAGITWRKVFCFTGAMFAITTSGAAYSCGNNSSGKSGQGTTSGTTLTLVQLGTATNWVSFSATSGGSSTIVGLNTSGELYACGTASQVNLLATLTVLTRVGTEAGFTAVGPLVAGVLAVKPNGQIYHYGTNAAAGAESPVAAYAVNVTGTPLYLGRVPTNTTFGVGGGSGGPNIYICY